MYVFVIMNEAELNVKKTTMFIGQPHMSKACKRLIKRKHLCIWQHSEKSFWFSNIFCFNVEFGCASVHCWERESEKKFHCENCSHDFPWADATVYCVNSYIVIELEKIRRKKRVQIEQRIWKIQTELDCQLNRLNVSMDAYHVCVCVFVRLRSRVCMWVWYAFSNISTSKFSLVVKKRESNTMARIIKLHKWKIEMS